MKNLDPLEKDIEAKCVQHAKSLGILIYKFTSPSRRSVPDRLFVLPGGRVFWVEFKRGGHKPTAAQEVEIEKIRKQGGTVYVVDNVKSGNTIIGGEFYGLTAKNLDEY
jgi:hypothetical protein